MFTQLIELKVNKVLGSKGKYPAENEIAFPGGVSADKIKGATKIGDNHSVLNPNYKK